MFAYCGNNPVNRCDPTGKLATWVISGLIGAVTNVSCALILGESGVDLIYAAIEGFVSSLPVIGTVLAVISAFDTSIKFSEITDNTFIGFLAGAMSLGTSLFTGANISKLPGLNQMDEAAELLFDAVLGYLANVFNTAAWDDIASYYEIQTEPYVQNEFTETLGQAGSAINCRGGAARHVLYNALS